MKIIVCDLDGTLTYDDKSVDYKEKRPNIAVIEKLRLYKADDYKIVIQTARNMNKYQGDLDKIKRYTLPIIEQWLKKYDVPFDEIIIGKPWCGKHGFYLDDKAIRPDEFLNLTKNKINTLINCDNNSNEMDTLFLITSAAYVDNEMQREFGKIPPIFLPLNNQFLLLEQAKSIPQSNKFKYITLPDDYEISNWQQDTIEKHGFEIIFCKTGLTLAESIIEAINQIGLPTEKIQILLGDTIFQGIDFTSYDDAVSVHEPSTNYKWSSLLKQDKVVSGFFSFSDPNLFLNCLSNNKDDFINAVEQYCSLTPQIEMLDQGKWFDFGHLQTYFSSRRSFTTERAFNNLHFQDHFVIKSSNDMKKMEAEFSWYKNLPSELSIYTPRLLDGVFKDEHQNYGYKIESLDAIALSDLVTSCKISLTDWAKIFSSSKNFLSKLHGYKQETKSDREAFFIDKTLQRLKKFSKQRNISLEADWVINEKNCPNLLHIANESWQIIKNSPTNRTCLIHGDFCFSNILYDSRSEIIRVIDPRGRMGEEQITAYGDPLYDFAKFYHSLFGYYDFIIGSRFELSQQEYNLNFSVKETAYVGYISSIAEDHLIADSGYSKDVLIATSVQLFLSMLPLHFDKPNRQIAMLANAYRLFSSIES